MGDGRLDSTLGSYSIPGIDSPPYSVQKTKLPAQALQGLIQGLCKSTLLYLALVKGSRIDTAENKDSRDRDPSMYMERLVFERGEDGKYVIM
jgi:hypothetical protein